MTNNSIVSNNSIDKKGHVHALLVHEDYARQPVP